MDTDDLNIKSHLAYSEKLHGLATGHLQETKQLLDTIGQLQEDLRHVLADNQRLRVENDRKDTQIKDLEQRVVDLKQNSTYHVSVSGDYVENQHVGSMYANPPILPKRRTAKPKPIPHNQTQLPLWNAPST